MRTYYVLTEDFSSFSSPKRLFDFSDKDESEMATIDVIIRKIGKNYYAVIKDERWPEDGVPTGKSIRLAKSSCLTGSYALINPKHPVTTPSTYFEAPILMPKPDGKGWMIFFRKISIRVCTF